jgi:hypothetical protein
VDAAAQMRHACEAVGEIADSLVAQGVEGETVEAVTGCDPEAGVETVAAKDFYPFDDETGLFAVIQAGEFRVLVEGEQASAFG